MRGPGAVALFGSGETSPSGRKVHAHLLARLPAPVKIAILDTPAGFQPNVALVADKIKQFFEQHLRDFQPDVYLVKAREKGGEFDPDNPALVDSLLDASYIFAGPGSPTYTVRQLAGTRALSHLVDRHAGGTIISLASAAAIASGSYALPVYEIFKAGEPLHWVPGLDLLGGEGLDLAVVTHWNNHEGGRELDTSRGYMGEERFRRLRKLLPQTTVVLGIDEHTACIIDLADQRCLVMGAGTVTVQAGGAETVYSSGEAFPIANLRVRDA